VNIALVESMIDNEVKQQKSAVDAQRYDSYEKAAGLMRDLVRAPKFVEFLTVPAYQRVLKEESFVVGRSTGS
jgi:malate synthase